MNGVHDLGGTDGLGPVIVEENEPVWHAEWEKAGVRHVPVPVRRRVLQRRPVPLRHRADAPGRVPALAATTSTGLHTAEHYGIRGGSHRPGGDREAHPTTSSSNPNEPLPDTKNPDLVAFADAAVKGGVVRPAGVRRRRPRSRSATGCASRDDSPKGHTRRARYIRGKIG